MVYTKWAYIRLVIDVPSVITASYDHKKEYGPLYLC